jgi:hypothetical protein
MWRTLVQATGVTGMFTAYRRHAPSKIKDAALVMKNLAGSIHEIQATFVFERDQRDLPAKRMPVGLHQLAASGKCGIRDPRGLDVPLGTAGETYAPRVRGLGHAPGVILF